MLTDKEINEIKDHLESAQNPLFFYDNDADGLMSYIILRKFIGRGKGVAVRTHPGVDVGYLRKIQELKADYVFVLDQPILGENFVKEVRDMGIPLVWIDHHDTEESYEDVFTYNSAKSGDKKAEPVTYLSYKITGRKEDMWFAVIGCVADNFMPDFYDEFKEKYKMFAGKDMKKPFDVYYKSGIGSLARALGFGLMDSVTHVVYLQNFLLECSSPEILMQEIDSYSNFGKKYREIKTKYDVLVNKAKKDVGDKILFFIYGGDLSISSEISNELYYLYPDKITVVAYDNGGISNLSLRGNNVRELIEKILPDFPGSTGGGHRDAVGVRLRSADLERFKESIYMKL
ncbi:hypothetical protein AUJ84_00720 [Candidatus Pacearchaeota archaeon CG1_02_32_132]|nr:MAG: hypothetical protein AUJ84_00720 [Candidatus Pacearchaeota archaeon CG1_02_32_132]